MILFEIKKILSRTGSKVGILVLLITLAVSCYFAVVYTTYVDEEGNEHTGITAINNLRKEKEKWTGVITEDYLKEVIRENNEINAVYPYDPSDPVSSDVGYSLSQGFEDIKTMINCAFGEFRSYNYLRVDSVTEDEVGNLYEKRIQNVKTWLSSDEAKDQYSEVEKTYIIGSYETLETPFYYEPTDGWRAALEYVITIIMMTMLVLSFFVSGIFSSEFQWKADSIFFSTKYGRNKGTLSKIAAGLIVVTFVYWTMIFLYSLIVFSIYGTSGANCVIQTSLSGWKSLYHITYLQEYLLVIDGGYVGVLFILLLSMLVSAKTHAGVIAVTIPFIMIFIQSFFGGFPNLTDVLGLLPDQLLQMNMATNTFVLYEIGGKVVPSVPILMTIYPILCVVLLPIMYHVYHRTEIN
ncbi:MAG: ABC transporter permease [Lachnospiraceae bacterium]